MTIRLNRGLNFAILPLKLDITQVLVGVKKFEKSIIWKEFWFGRDKEEFKPPIFKSKKINLPKKLHCVRGAKHISLCCKVGAS